MELFSKLYSILQKSELVYEGRGLGSGILKVYTWKMGCQCFTCQMKITLSYILGFCVVLAQTTVVGILLMILLFPPPFTTPNTNVC